MEYEYMDKFIGQALQSKRTELKYSLSYVGDRIGISKQRLCNYEQGIRTMPLDIYVKVCKVLDIDHEVLFDEAQKYMRKQIFK